MNTNKKKKRIKSNDHQNMSTSLKYILLIILMVLLFSCSSSTEPDDINKKIIGTWVLDSASAPSGKYYKATNSSKFILKEGFQYAHEWMNGDVRGSEEGKFAITINNQRAIATLSFIPNIVKTHKDTIRMRYLNFDVVELNSERLHAVEQTEFIERKGLPSVIFNKHFIYKRSK